MRFGRRNRASVIWGRRSDSDDPGAAGGEAEQAVRNEVEGDPAQSLMSVLGRFQRHYLRGREGTEQSAWSDDAMNSLIDAVDVAVSQRWHEVVSVLTETARILQTYEDAERANECVPFLTSSHEILCHMVGDLLDGQIRPGLTRKWDALYTRACADVDSVGLSLVQDEMSDQELAHQAFGVGEHKDSPFDEPSPNIVAGSDEPAAMEESQAGNGEPESPVTEPLPFELPELKDDEPSDSEDLPSLDDLPDLSDSSTPAFEDTVEAESNAEDADSESRIVSFPGPVSGEEPEAEAESDDEFGEDASLEDEQLATVAAPAESVMEAECADETAPANDDISGILDLACEALSNLTENLETFEEQVLELEARADEFEWEGASAACRSVLRLMDMLEARNIEPTDRFLELAYGFSGVYVESRDSVKTEEYRAFQKDCVTLLQDWMDDRDAESAEEPIATAAVNNDDASENEGEDAELTNLLDTVRAAMQGGHASNAKLLMLEAAARIAQEQEGEAAALVSDAESALNENARALEAARAAVQENENRVTETAAKVSEVQHGQEAHQRQSAELAETLEEAKGRVDLLDEQIRELEKQRAAAESERAKLQEELDAVHMREQEHEAELESVRNVEREARVQLENERRHAKTLQSSRGDLERAVIAKRELLARQRQSTQDIEQTIAHTRDSETGETADQNESLF